jgi:glycosyltransferase involved in cell wall biosynthesis
MKRINSPSILMDRKNDKGGQPPLLSIIIPTYNRPESLRNCLVSFAGLKEEIQTFEIIVVDDGSTPPCGPIVKTVSIDRECLVLRQENKGPAAARNHGARNARGRFLAFIDDDCSVPADWLRQVLGCLDERAMVGGITKNMLPGVCSEASQILVDYLYQQLSLGRGPANFITSNNMIIPARFFHEINGFSEIFPMAAAEDRDLCFRWLRAGYEIRLVPAIVVEHYHKLTLFQFLQQHFSYGSGACLYHERRKISGAEKIKLEPIRFYFQLLLFPFQKREKSFTAALLLSLCLILSQICNCAGFLWAIRKLRSAKPIC